MDLRSDLGEQVIVVDVRRPHRLVHVGHEAYIGFTEHRPCQGRAGEDPDLFIHLISCAHDEAHILPWNPAHRAGSLKGADQCARAEIFNEIILIKCGLERHPVFRHVHEDHRDLGAIPQETDPGEVLAP